MVAKSDKEKVKTLLSETIRLLCKNGLQFKAEFCVEALVGITLDQDEEFFLSIKETVKSDIVSSTRESSPPPHRKSKSDRKSREVHVKTDVSPSSCQRKRISDREPTESGDFQQDVGQSYWGNSSVHGEDSGGGNTPRKRRHIQTTQEDDSNPQIVIKGEPDSDSDIEEVASTSQDDHSLGAMPGTFGGYLPAPDQSYLDNVSSQPLPQQVWDQLPPFSSLPGTSAVPTTPSTMASGAGHSQVRSRYHGYPRSEEERRIRLVRKILLSKGSVVSPRTVSMNLSGLEKVPRIIAVMQELTEENLGTYTASYTLPYNFTKRKVFIKKPADEIMDGLLKYGVNVEAYTSKFLEVQPIQQPRGRNIVHVSTFSTVPDMSMQNTTEFSTEQQEVDEYMAQDISHYT